MSGALSSLVLQALAHRAGLAGPHDAAARRRVWTAAGVVPDLASASCLTLGLSPLADAESGRGRWWAAAGEGAPVHVTAWDLRARTGAVWRAWNPGRPVLVCQSPHLVEAVAQKYGGAVPLLCMSHATDPVAAELMRRLVDGGTALRFHGDFDWQGVATANRLIDEVGAMPFLMGAKHYEAGLREGLAPLAGPPVTADWDGDLGHVMREVGLALPEELIVPEIVADLL